MPKRTAILVPLGVDKTSKGCKSFTAVPNPNGTVCLYLDPARLNQALIRQVYRGSTVNDIFPGLTNVHYLTLMDIFSEYHNLKPDKNLSYSTTFACQFGRYRYARIPFGAAPANDMFKHKWMTSLGNYHTYLVLKRRF